MKKPMNAYAEGKIAAQSGKSLSDNPYATGEFTKLGEPKFSEGGYEWNDGFRSAQERWATKKEIADAEAMDISKFRRKSKRYYK